MESIVLSYGDSLLRERDLKLLESPSWLNDTLISFYLEYVADRRRENGKDDVVFVNCSSSQCVKLSGGVDYLLEPLLQAATRYVMFPVSDSDDMDAAGGSHWSLAVLDLLSGRFYHFDSMGTNNDSAAKRLMRNLQPLLEGRSHSGLIKFVEMKTLRQDNGYDCGIHVLCNADSILDWIDAEKKIDDCPALDRSTVDRKRSDLLELIKTLSKK